MPDCDTTVTRPTRPAALFAATNFFHEGLMMQFSRRLLSVASAAVLAGLAACGEDTVEPSGNPPAVTALSSNCGAASDPPTWAKTPGAVASARSSR